MRILIVTNLYPPQELGGYGRCIADFVWGLQQRLHFIQVLSADAPYLYYGPNPDCVYGPSGELVSRVLRLKGSYDSGVSFMQDVYECEQVDKHNTKVLKKWLSLGWDGILLGNIDLLGPEIIPILTNSGTTLLHHIGFTCPPFAVRDMPESSNYNLLAASYSVRNSLVNSGLPVSSAPIVYPGARCELFSPKSGTISNALISALFTIKDGHPLGTKRNPLKIGFAGLLMGSKGLHTVVQSLILLHKRNIAVHALFAGADFQEGYRFQLQHMLKSNGLDGTVQFVGNLNRPCLARFWSLNHIGIFPSINPEAFGIVGAEIMASGVALLSTCVGGSAELIEHGRTGLSFSADQPDSLVDAILTLLQNPQTLFSISQVGKEHIEKNFSVESSVLDIERLFSSKLYLASRK